MSAQNRKIVDELFRKYDADFDAPDAPNGIKFQLEIVLDEKDKKIQTLLDGLNALAHPDGVIRGPLVDGPELDDLNRIKADVEGMRP